MLKDAILNFTRSSLLCTFSLYLKVNTMCITSLTDDFDDRTVITPHRSNYNAGVLRQTQRKQKYPVEIKGKSFPLDLGQS